MRYIVFFLAYHHCLSSDRTDELAQFFGQLHIFGVVDDGNFHWKDWLHRAFKEDRHA